VTGANGKVIALDTWTMLAYLDAEPAAQDIRQMLRRARKKDVLVLFSLINYGECLYVIERARGLQQTQLAVGIIDQLAVRVVPIDRSLVFEAAHIKARYPISYADAFSVALAKRNRACVMTGDPEFKAVEPDIVIHWLPDRRSRD
jgi:ribonuclease VapC